ncbi:hypothetical protein L917_17867 [Phytophthora nicotianae]|uniref:Glycosyltransferase 61 catalytic domain-containing protein n=2 Tax=Phytophthora nicotianae TaxID=4792 RepID=V9E775_PHYNI|nr:hypothetical protein F443_18665 [Phytophthora nicotianae P1569]ETL81888.1 hypothetical protein L917_17867 [Phytophthora nicotianae]
MPKDDAAPSTAVSVSPTTLCGPRRRLLQTLALVLLLLGALSMVARIVDLSAATSSFRTSDKSQSGLSVRGPTRHSGYQQQAATSVNSTSTAGQTTTTNTPVATTTPPPVTQPTVEQLKKQEQLKSLVIQRTKAPHDYSSVETKNKCYAQRDVGIIAAVQQAARNFCADGGWDSVKQAPVSPEKATKVSTFRVAGGIRSATFQNLMLDLVEVGIHAPIKSMAEDGGKHDPRFNFNMRLVNCACDELANHFRKLPGDKERKAEQIWQPSLMGFPEEGVPMSTICSPRKPENTKRSAWDFVKNPLQAPDNNETVVFEDPVVLIARRDDHNPFFQISYALNSWIMLQALGWDVTKTHVIHLDGGYPSPIDALHQGLLAPNHEIIDGATLIGKRVHFRGDVMVAPFELSGPMMQHLDNEEPCFESELMKTFRAQSLLTLNVTPEMERELGVTTVRPMIVTVITRRPYDGRKLQRMWVNEDEVMSNMRIEYKGLNVEFRSIDYVNLTLFEQMKTTIESDMIISMHGAGLVNVIWARPMTTVVEIFPKERFRWGYRNMCQFVGCDWHEFRGGQDIGDNPTPNTKNKRIPYDEWMSFFHPLFRQSYGAFEEQQAVLRGEAS